MADNAEVTGIDLYDLWRVATINLPTVQAVYAEAANDVHEWDLPDTEKYGRGHAWWAVLAQQYESALFLTGASLAAASEAVKRAVDDFSTVDGTNGERLTAAGEELRDLVADPTFHDPDDELDDDEKPETFQAPNWEPPEDWYTRD